MSTPSRAPRRLSRLRRALRALTLLAGGGLLSVGLGLVWLNTPAGNQWLHRLILAQAAQRIPEATLEIGQLAVRIPGFIDLHDVQLTRWDGVVMARIEHLRLEYSLARLLGGEVNVDLLLLESPAVRLEVMADGRLDWLRALGIPPSTEPSPPPVPWEGLDARIGLTRALLTQGRLIHIAGPEAEPFVVEGIALDGAARVGGGRRAQLDHLSVQATPGPYDTVFLDGSLAYRDSVVTTEDLSLYMGGSRVLVRGVVASVEVQPLLNLEVSALPLAHDSLTPFAGAEVLRQDLHVDARVRGTLSALGLGLSASAQAGTLAAQGMFYLDQEPLPWSLEVWPQALSLDALVPSVTQPVRLEGHYRIDAHGTTWPSGLSAVLEAEAPEQVIWGQVIEAMEIDASLDQGVLSLSHAFARHPAGSARLTDGSIDLIRENASFQADLRIPALSALERFGLVGYQGAASVQGPIHATWDGAAPTVDALLLAEGLAIGSSAFALDRVSTEALQVSLIGETVHWSGAARLEGLGASGVRLASLDLRELAGDYQTSDGSVQTTTQLSLADLQVGDGTFVLDGLQGGLRAGVNAQGEPFLETQELRLHSMRLVPLDFALDGGPVSLSLSHNHLLADLSLRRADRVVIETTARGDLGTGRWRVEDLFLFPTAEKGIVNPAASPIEFTLVGSSGVQDLALVLVLSGQDPLRVDPRFLPLETASYIALQGGTTGANPDLKLEAVRVDMAWVSAMVNLFLSESPETPFLAPMTGTLDLLAATEGSDTAAALAVDLQLKDFSFPEVADAIQVSLQAGGRLDSPEFSLTVQGQDQEKGREKEKEVALLLAASGQIPVDVAGGMLDCTRDLRLRALLAPLSMSTLQARLPALAGVPEGEASADVHLTGSACDPQARMVGAFTGPLGEQGRYGRLDLVLTRQDGVTSFEAFAEESGVRRLEASGQAQDRLDDLLTWSLQGTGDAPDLTDPESYVRDFQVNLVPLEVPLDLLARMAGSAAQVSGRLVGGISLSGSVDDPQLTGGLVLLDTRIGDTEVTSAQINLLPELDPDLPPGYTLSTRVNFAGEGGLEIDGIIPLTLARIRDEETETLYDIEGWKLTAQGPGLPLAMLEGLVDGVEDARGLMSLKGELSGSLNDLSSDLRLRIDGGRLTYLPLEVRYEDLHLDLHQKDETLTLRDTSLKTAPLYGLAVRPPGSLTLNGSATLQGPVPHDLKLRARLDDLSLIATQELRLASSGELTLSGDWPALSVGGAVRLTEGVLTLEDSFFTGNADLGLNDRLLVVRGDEVDEEALLAALGARRGRGQPQEISDFMQQFRANVQLDLNNNLHLDMTYPLESGYGEQLAQLTAFGLNADMTGLLTATYLSNTLDLVGDIELIRGEAQILNRSFDVETDSQIRFVGGDYANPFLSIKARYATQQYGDVVLDIGGTASDIGFEYSSENAAQEYDQSDLLSILLLGRPASALADSEGESNNAALSLALSTVSGSVSSALGGTLVDEVDLDLETGVRIGKSISEKLFLAYDRNTSAEDTENINQVTLEWLISRRLYAEFMTGDRAQSSVNLYWRRVFGEAGTFLHNPHLMPGQRPAPALAPAPDAP